MVPLPSLCAAGSLEHSNRPLSCTTHVPNRASVPDGFLLRRPPTQAHRCNYTTAESHCIRAGGHLATILTPAENNAVHGLCHSEECWIGFNDIREEGKWVWMDGTAAGTTVVDLTVNPHTKTDTGFDAFPGGKAPWNTGEPNGLDWEQTDGAYMYPTTTSWTTEGSWDDDDISKERAFVCRVPDGPPLAPSPPPPPPRKDRAGPFIFVKEPKLNWPAAEANCAARGGHLASIHSPAENKVVQELCEPAETWIGFNDLREEGTWEWNDGSAATFELFEDGKAPWNPGEPNGHNTTSEPTDGAYMYTITNQWVMSGSWDDDDITKLRSYVCRVTMPPRPPRPPPPPHPLPPVAPGGGGGGAGVVFLVLFLLVLVGGGVFWVVRQRRAGQPLLPASLSGLSPFGARAQTRPGSDSAVYTGGPQNSATPYMPPLSSGPAMVAAPNFQGVAPPAGVPGGGWGSSVA